MVANISAIIWLRKLFLQKKKKKYLSRLCIYHLLDVRDRMQQIPYKHSTIH